MVILMFARIYLTFAILFFIVSTAWAGPIEELRGKYPSESYLIGVGEVQLSEDSYKDRRRAEMLARLEIAKIIKVTIKETTTDFTCERTGKILFENKAECVNQFTMLVEESVNEVLEDSKIVDAGEDKTRGVYYAVAVMLRSQATVRMEDGFTEAIEKVKGHIEVAKTTEDEAKKKEEIEKAKEELMKGLSFAAERSGIDKVRESSSELIDKLAVEINKIEGSK